MDAVRIELKIRVKETILKIVKINEVKPEEMRTPLFTGPTSVQPLITTQMSKQFIINQVNFAKSVVNRLHSHTSEQVLIVTKGRGIVATETEQAKVGPGTIIIFAAGEKHWHGAQKGFTFSHITVTNQDSKTTQFEQ
jgi:quercetin dioxygenase-like cupin family protein